MSDVRINGNTYKGVTTIKLEKAAGGKATYNEAGGTDPKAGIELLLSGGFSGDFIDEKPYQALKLGIFRHQSAIGTLSFPYATKIGTIFDSAVCENLLLPNVSGTDFPKTEMTLFKGTKISGTLDLSGWPNSKIGLNQAFFGSTIGTLKIGKMQPHNGMVQAANITNLVWNLNEDRDTQLVNQLKIATKIDNLYIADAFYDEVNQAITSGGLTTVKALHRFSEWSDV